MNGEQTDDLTTALRRGADLAPAPPVDLLERVAHRRRQQRRARVAVLAAAAAVAVVAAGVPVGASLLASSDPAPATQPADPTPPAIPTTPATTTTAAPTTPLAPTTDPVTTAPSTSQPPAPPELVLGPEGLGSLVLGMSLDEAEATGELPSAPVFDGPGCGYTDASDGGAVFSPDLGLVYVSAPRGVASPQGVEVGMTSDAARAAMPGLELYPGLADPSRSGRGFLDAEGWPDRHYRVAWEDGVVTEVSIELRMQDCYE